MRRVFAQRTVVRGRRVLVWVAMYDGVRVAYAPSEEEALRALDWWEKEVVGD